jgi:hypothetical protein
MTDYRTPKELRQSLYKWMKVWLPIIFSFAALAIASATAYFTTLIASDDIRVVIGRAPMFVLTRKGDIDVSGISELTFINSGNRQAAIIELSALITKLENFASKVPSCRTLKTTQIHFTESAFVMKPGEILVKKPEMFLLGNANGNATIPKGFFSGIFTVNANDVFLACLSLTVITPDSYSKAVDQPVYKYIVRKEDEPLSDPALPLFEFGKPVVMLKRSHFIFWE